jgi:hypothetical protein
MVVPKMVKNGNNSLFTIRNRFCYQFGIHALKIDQNPEEELKPFYTNFGTRMRAKLIIQKRENLRVTSPLAPC